VVVNPFAQQAYYVCGCRIIDGYEPLDFCVVETVSVGPATFKKDLTVWVLNGYFVLKVNLGTLINKQ
jgi:hypothetical protein